MLEITRRKLLGPILYTVYRRIRFLNYKRKLQKQLRRKRKQEIKANQLEVRTILRNQSKSERLAEKMLRRRQKAELRHEKEKLRKEAKAQRALELKLERQKVQAEKERSILEAKEIRLRLKVKVELEKKIQQEQKQKLRVELREYRRRKKHLRPYIYRRRLRAYINGIRSINRQRIKDWFLWSLALSENKTERNRFTKIFLNSLMLFLGSYLFLFMLGEVITVWVATSFDYKTILFPYKIYYNIESDQWTADAVKILYSIIPFTGLVIGSVFLIIYSLIRNEAGYFKMFFLWGFVHGTIMFFGATLMGTLLNQGFGWVVAYLYYRDTGKMVFSIFSIFALVTVGTALTRSFLISGNTYFNNIREDNRRILFVSQVLIPALVGSIVLILLKIPTDDYYTTTEEYIYEVSKISTILLILLPIGLSFRSSTDIFFDEDSRIIRLAWPVLVITLLIFLLHYLLLYSGIRIEP